MAFLSSLSSRTVLSFKTKKRGIFEITRDWSKSMKRRGRKVDKKQRRVGINFWSWERDES